jgi:hypothetical protein
LARLAAAANRGLAEHPSAPQPLPRILWNQGTTNEALEEWQRAGVPIDFAESALYELAKSHRASEPITSLRYFLNQVIKRWRQQNAAADMAVSRPATLAPAPDALTRWAEEDDACLS